ncbi:MAG: alpha-hydroxy-acid oxidizing protein, partial [Candidatus Binatia bacterium]
DLLTRVKAAGYSALCLTVDTAHYGHRERQMMDRWLPPSRRGVGYECPPGLLGRRWTPSRRWPDYRLF